MSQPPEDDLISVDLGITPRALAAVVLYRRCALFHEIALPCPGGVLEQPEIVAAVLETVHTNVQQMRERASLQDDFRQRHLMNVRNVQSGKHVVRKERLI